MNDSAISFCQVNKYFGSKHALQNVSFEIPQHGICGVIGPNGSGKTTTLRLILHIYLPSSGQILVLGKQDTRSANDWVGYLPEERGLYRKMTVDATLRYFGHLKGMQGADLKKAIDYWLERLGLPGVHRMRIEQLSKGMAQKIQFIAAIMFEPKLLILDEPFSGLDPVNLELINEVIRELKEKGVTIILSTHDMGVAERLCDRVVMIDSGHKVLDGSISEIRSRHGRDAIRILCGKGRETLEAVEGISGLHHVGRFWELNYAGTPEALLKEVVERDTVSHFELTHPSLHDIFVRLAQVPEGEKSEWTA